MGTSLALLLFLAASKTAFSVSKYQCLNPLGKEINQLAISFHRIIAHKSRGNFFLSPMGFGVSLGMLYSESQGKTAEVMRTVLGYDQVHLSDSPVYSHFKNLMETYKKSEESEDMESLPQPRLVSAVFAQKDYSATREYKERLFQYFHAIVRDVDFQNEGVKTVQKINDCVKFSTDNEIKKLLGYDYFDESTVTVLLIAGFIPTMWETECATSDMVFYNNGSPSEKTKVKMIHIVGEFSSVRLGKGILLRLPFKDGRNYMMAYLPDDFNGVHEAEQNFPSNVAIAALKQAKKDSYNVSLPILNQECSTILTSELQKLGIPVCGKSTDEASGTCVSEVINTVRVKIDPKGSTGWGFAAVATETARRYGGNETAGEITTGRNEQGSEPSGVTRMEGGFKNIIFNHPYVFAFVDDENDLIYLQGRVCEL